MFRRRKLALVAAAIQLDEERWSYVSHLMSPGEERIVHTPIKIFNLESGQVDDRSTIGWDDGFLYLTDLHLLVCKYTEHPITQERSDFGTRTVAFEEVTGYKYDGQFLDLRWIDGDGDDNAMRFSLFPSPFSNDLTRQLKAVLALHLK